jgi:hypothetical protein
MIGGRRRSLPMAAAALGLAVAIVTGPAGRASAQELEPLLREVGESYARGYLAPLVSAVGAAQLSALATTAAIPSGRLRFGLAVHGVAVNIAPQDRSFRQVRQITLNEDFGVEPDNPIYGGRATLVSEGPTVFGSEQTPGRLTAYLDGVPVYAEQGIEGLLRTEWPLLAVPEVSVAGVAHLRASLRWLPRLSLGMVRVSLLGGGLTYGLSGLLPGLPVDLAVGAFRQAITVEEALSATATSVFAIASRDLGRLTAYGAFALEKSEFDIDYLLEGFELEHGLEERVSFTMEGRQTRRLTAGVTLHGLGPRLNLEAGFGHMTTVSSGLQVEF